MTWHPFKKRDWLTGHRLRPEWIVERDGILNRAMANWDTMSGTCMDCGRPLAAHPPGRMMRSGPDLCAQAKP